MRTTLAIVCLSLIAARLDAQCANAWAPFGTLPGVDHAVNAVASWDPDGPGPLTPRVVVGGLFGTAGGVQASAVAAWDPPTAQWSALGAGPAGPSSVNALLTLANGDLVAGGSNPYSATAVSTLARWNGTSWTPFGGLTASSQGVSALAQLPNGDLAVGGYFTSAGALALPYVGAWNGTSWSSLGGGMNGPVLDLVVMPNGDLVAVGAFTIAGGVPANGVARWNGTAWSALGAGITGSVSGPGPQGEAAVVLSNSDLVVGGNFTQAGGVPAPGVARWDGTSWSAFGGGVTGSGYSSIGVRGLVVMPNGDLVAGGFFMDAGGVPIPNIARWNGTAWSSLGAGIPTGAVNALAVLPSGDLVAGGTFAVAGNVGAANVARWNGSAWSSLGNGTAPSDDVRSLISMPDGSIVAGGLFRAAGGVAAYGIARWNGAAWSAVGGGFAPSGAVNAMALQPNGDLVAGGNGLVSTWNGAAWTHLPAAMTGSVPHARGAEAVAVLANGDIVVGGDFATIDSLWINGLARWNGTAWSMLGSQTPGQIHAMATLSNGDLVVGGGMWMPHPQANNIARWNGTVWSPLGTGLGDFSSEVFAIAPLPNGALIAGGRFASAGGLPASNIARWNGTTWSPIGAGLPFTVRAVHVLPNGDVLAAGEPWQAGGVWSQGSARWDGTAWSAIGNSISPYHPGLLAIAALPNGDLLVGGGFDGLGTQFSPNLVRLTTTCPATAQRFGSGCMSSGGMVDLGATALPWLGATFHSRATGLPANALAWIAYGFQSATLPLSAVVSPAGAGCHLWQTIDLLAPALPTAGTLDIAIGTPDVPALLGLVLHQQVGAVELQGAVVLEVTSSNRLTLVFGRF